MMQFLVLSTLMGGRRGGFSMFGGGILGALLPLMILKMIPGDQNPFGDESLGGMLPLMLLGGVGGAAIGRLMPLLLYRMNPMLGMLSMMSGGIGRRAGPSWRSMRNRTRRAFRAGSRRGFQRGISAGMTRGALMAGR
jgi:hypothetical protein